MIILWGLKSSGPLWAIKKFVNISFLSLILLFLWFHQNKKKLSLNMHYFQDFLLNKFFNLMNFIFWSYHIPMIFAYYKLQLLVGSKKKFIVEKKLFNKKSRKSCILIDNFFYFDEIIKITNLEAKKWYWRIFV